MVMRSPRLDGNSRTPRGSAFGGQRFYAANARMTFSTNRKNPVLRVRAPSPSCSRLFRDGMRRSYLT